MTVCQRIAAPAIHCSVTLDDSAKPPTIDPKPSLRTSLWTRRKFLRATTAAAVTGLGIYAGVIEPNQVKVERIELRLKRLAAELDGFRIALMADLHFAPYTGEREIGVAVERANELGADLVCVVGDFVTELLLHGGRSRARYAEPCAAVLGRLRSRYGTVAVLGNHDHQTNAGIVTGALQAHGIRVLRNENFALERGRARLWIAGIDDAVTRNADIAKTLANIPPQEAIVALAHEPDVADSVTQYPVDVQLSGHSHGGQINVPGMRRLYLPRLARKYPEGLYH